MAAAAAPTVEREVIVSAPDAGDRTLRRSCAASSHGGLTGGGRRTVPSGTSTAPSQLIDALPVHFAPLAALGAVHGENDQGWTEPGSAGRVQAKL